MIATLYSLAWGIGCFVAALVVIAAGITRCKACGGWCEGGQDCDRIRKERGL